MVTCCFRPGDPLTFLLQGISLRFQVLLYPEDRPLRSKTCAANDTVELLCPWCESLPLTAAAPVQENPTERVFNFRYHDFLLVWNWKSDRSVLRCESVLPEVISGAAPIASLQFAPARPSRPRGASFVVLSSAVCKVGRRIRQRGFHVGWYDLTLDPANLRRLRSDARSGRVLPGQAACPKPVERPQMLRDNSLSRKTSKRETSGRMIAIIREL